MAQNTAALQALADFRFVDSTPFSAFDLAIDTLEEAYSLMIVISDAVAAGGDDPTIRSIHLNKAFSGVMTLMSLSAFAHEQAREAR